MSKVLVFGSTGFVGSAVCSALEDRGYKALGMKSPRIATSTSLPQLEAELAQTLQAVDDCQAVVNAAGVPDATGDSNDQMRAANGILPGVLAAACSIAGVRFVHVSSAAVQGRTRILDSSPETQPFSPYSESKADGESRVRQFRNTVVYRPPGVHGAERPVTSTVARLARSKFACVAADGSDNSAQALIENVADAIAYLATCEDSPPRIVAHPSEGLTTARLLENLGGKSPAVIPRFLAHAIVSVGFLVGRVLPFTLGHARRVEMLWFGQDQADSWLTQSGWSAKKGPESWQDLGRTLANNTERKDIN